jgi:FixJ family two-component response regulator
VSAGPVISIIDDDESVRIALVGLVRSLGYGARGFASAEEFLADGTVDGFACIITDIHMPGMSGIELNRHLAACRYGRPVIMITGRDEADLEERALASGAAFFLRKPLKAETLVDCLQRALKA